MDHPSEPESLLSLNLSLELKKDNKSVEYEGVSEPSQSLRCLTTPSDSLTAVRSTSPAESIKTRSNADFIPATIIGHMYLFVRHGITEQTTSRPLKSGNFSTFNVDHILESNLERDTFCETTDHALSLYNGLDEDSANQGSSQAARIYIRKVPSTSKPLMIEYTAQVVTVTICEQQPTLCNQSTCN